MIKVVVYFIGALFMIGAALFSITTIHNIAQPFIEMSISDAETTRILLSSDENIIRTITTDQRKIWLENLSQLELQATGIIVMRNIASYVIGILFIGYILQCFFASYKSYRKLKNDRHSSRKV